jgi:hypothetical protein
MSPRFRYVIPRIFISRNCQTLHTLKILALLMCSSLWGNIQTQWDNNTRSQSSKCFPSNKSRLDTSRPHSKFDLLAHKHMGSWVAGCWNSGTRNRSRSRHNSCPRPSRVFRQLCISASEIYGFNCIGVYCHIRHQGRYYDCQKPTSETLANILVRQG